MKGLWTIGLSAALTASALAGTYTFQPNPADGNDLDHYKYYSWGLRWSVPENEVIVDAVLTIRNIYDWQVEEDVLYTHLLDNPAAGFVEYDDGQVGGDNWAGKGPKIGEWSDPVGGHARNFDLVYRFSDLGLVDELREFAADGKFGIGFDADCHYFNDGIKLKITTEPVPEPATMLAMGTGLVAFMRARKLRRKA